MDEVNAKALVEKILEDRHAFGMLCEAIARDTKFAREMTKSLSRAVRDNCSLLASGVR